MKAFGMIAVAALGAVVWAKEPAPEVTVRVDPSAVVGPVKLMNAVNNGPSVAKANANDQKRGNFTEYAAARFPYARLHDSINCCSGGAHCVDISAVFPDFDADEDNPKSYDFVFTDHYLDSIVRTGTKVFFRLGQTIEHGPKKYGIFPPKDYAKWARVCEHIVRHYNEGWGWGADDAWTTVNVAWSNQFNVVYWEIWNEPDMYRSEDPKKLYRKPLTWGGTVTNFFNFYEVAAKHLKGKFPALKIGGPALAGNEGFADRFLNYCQAQKVPLDFFSWHIYATEPDQIGQKCARIRAMLDKYGFGKTESILDEWNYVKGWSDDWVYTLEVESGRYNQKAAAFIASTMIECQRRPLDMLMFYDARLGTAMNSLFNATTYWPMKGYYPFYAWSRLVDCGTEVACALDGKATDGFSAMAAKGTDGRVAVFVSRYSSDDNVSESSTVRLRAPGIDCTRVRCHVTDAVRTYTEIPLVPEPNGGARLHLLPNSFALIEL